MTNLNIYDFTVPQQIRMLNNLSAILTKASNTAPSLNLDTSTFPSARLHATMLPLSFQIKIACDMAKRVAVEIGGSTTTSIDTNDLVTMEDLQTRIAQTIAALETVKREDYDGKDTETFQVYSYTFSGLEYAVKFDMPNFYFHITATYAILRSLGVDLGKMDYLGGAQ